MSDPMQHYIVSAADKRLISRAIKVVEKQLIAAENLPDAFSPSSVADYLRLQLWEQDREHFLVLFLDNQNRLIAAEKLFSGSLSSVEVHPRVIARKALLLNANSIILAHNHPSGEVYPSKPDLLITQRIKMALSLLDIRVLDHIIISAGTEYWSFAEHGQMDMASQQVVAA
ncbi:DNA repair protein RadC [Citrobacter sp. wls619]|uniref:RadC family protein n=1 Tax=Citrobacter sp. wls619 TaxID=2576432 RepID=UPI0010C9F537|nr:DNA repair protein RadC [Citrobacter sp. wls619]TKV13906.1 DNA repair protein RadC [Citrobacter sp. wls619]